jgi:hypothetical protein
MGYVDIKSTSFPLKVNLESEEQFCGNKTYRFLGA